MLESTAHPIASGPFNMLVSGAGSGIGRGLCQRMAGKKHRLFCADVSLDGALETVRSLGEGPAASAHAMDVTSSTQIARFLEEIGDERIDVIINNAGLQHVSPIEIFHEEKWDLLIDVMLKGTFLLARAILPRMRAHGFGRIINIGSIHSLVASPFKSAYVAAKHGLIGLSKTIALETANLDITVNTICPAYVRTPLVDAQICAQGGDRQNHAGADAEEVLHHD